MTDADALREAMARAIEAAYTKRLRRIVRDGPHGQPPESVEYVDAALSAAEAAGYALVPVEATEKARETLRMAAETFRKYEQLHRDKGTDEGQAKANSNMIIAQLCEKAHAAMIAAAKEKP